MDIESLRKKLNSLGADFKDVETLDESKPRICPVEKVVSGYEKETIFGACFIVETQYDRDLIHGSTPIYQELRRDLISSWAKEPGFRDLGNNKIVFVDTETSGLSGGTGTIVFMVGIGFFSEDKFVLQQYFLRSPQEETAMLTALDEMMTSYEALVSFNGKSFDIPMLRTRYTLNSLSFPFENTMHIDLLHLARKLWKKRLPSRALADLEGNILNVVRGQDEVPGWMVPQLYYDYLRTGDASPLKGVFYHNSIDILSLASLLVYVGQMLEDPISSTNIDNLDLAAIAILYEDLGYYDEALVLYDRCLKLELPPVHHLDVMKRFALLLKKQGIWQKAISLWISMAERQQVDACIELAKYYEHREKDISQALYWSFLGLDVINKEYVLRAGVYNYSEDLKRRIERLTRKMKKSGE